MIIFRIRALRFPIITISKHSLHNIYYFCCSVNRFNANNGAYTVVDFIDSFTNGLTKKLRDKSICDQNSQLKCHNLSSDKFSFIARRSELNMNIQNMMQKQIDLLIVNALKSNKIEDLEYILKECIENSKMPSLIIMNRVLSLYANNANIQMIEALEKYIKLEDRNFSPSVLNFELYLAKANWIKGYIDKAFHIFVNLYKNNKTLKHEIRKMLEILISECTTETSIMLINENVLYFADCFGDWYPLYFFWKSCFFSQEFKERQLAEGLYDKFEKLRNISSDSLPFLSSVALKNHDEDAVIRLLQLVLKHDMMRQYKLILNTLFDYRYKRDDFRGCSEIIINSIDLDIYLTPDRLQKYMSMLLLHKYGFKSKSMSFDKINKPASSFKFKF